MIGPIEGPNGPGPIGRPDDVSGAKPSEDVRQPFDLNRPDPSTDVPGAASPTRLEVFGNIVQDGINQGLGNNQILEEVAKHELGDAFGESGTKEMVKAIAEVVASDPNMSQLFGRLLAMVSPSAEPGTDG